ncbi:MAG TPA: hypothetical protein DHV62_09360 [Elusimicrobia bacterium]|nr:hypothetical protein [Elusimicrobiota bacterium]
MLYFEKKDYEQAAEFFNETVKKSVPLREDDIKDASSYYLLSCYQRENNISKMEEMLNFLPLPVEPIGIDEFCFDYDDIVEKTLQGMLNSKVNELTKAKAKGILAYLIKEKRLPNIEKREIDRKFTSKELKDLNYGLQLIQDCLEYYPDNNTFNGVYSDLLYLKKDYDNSFIYKIKTLANRSKEEYLCSVYLTECSDKFLDNYVSHIKQELENIYNAEEEYIKYDFSGDLQSLFERKKYRTIDNLFKWLEDKLDLEKVEKEYKSYYGGGLFEIAYSSEEVGNINRAKYLYEKYLEINGESSSVLNNLAIIYEQQGNLKRAKKFIKRAKQLTKGNDETINRNFTRIFAKTKTKKEKKISEESEPSAISKENVSRKKIRTLVKFPTPSGATWDMVSIQFVSDDSVKISVKSIHKRYTFAEIGFKDHRKGDLPDSQWELLKYLAKKNGELSWQKDSAKPNVQKRIQELRKRLKFLMGIDDDPFFPYRQYKAYKTKFLIEDKSYSSTEQEPPVESNF